MAELKWAKKYQKIYDRSQTPSGWNSLDKVRIEEIDGLMGEVDALKAQIKQLEDSRFALAVAHTEDVLTIERLKAPVSDKEMDRFSIHYINVINPFRSLPVLTITQATALIAARAAAPVINAVQMKETK
jgi:hypothetical protein